MSTARSRTKASCSFEIRLRIVRSVALLALAAMANCTAIPRKPAPWKFFGNARPGGLPAEVRSTGLDEGRVAAVSRDVMTRVRAAASDGTIDVLALSGGGAGGAFGAGVLVGMTHRGQRPQFEIVTGVSAGAIIAPFAFLGSSWDAKLTDALAGAETGRVLRRRFFDVLTRPSLYRGKPLADFVQRIASDALIDAVASESAKGRLLLVATTDLDKGATIVWNMGAIALQHTAASRKLFRDVLLASMSIPAIFPPVMIQVQSDEGAFDEMHVDGGTTVPFFVAPEVAHIVPGSIAGLAGTNLYVLMNTQLGEVPDTVPGRLGPIIERSFTAVLNSMARKELLVAVAFAREHEMDFRVTSIPIDYPFGGSIDFRPGDMRALFDYGERCAEQGAVWTTPAEALRRTDAALDAASSPRTKSMPPGEIPCPLEARR
jgi:predicted acylesterase/phospholipase RssA